MSELKGADVSRWQGVINFVDVKSALKFVIAKASGGDGGLYPDSQFSRNKGELRAQGLLRGFYHFAGAGDPVAEADHFVNTVGDIQKGEILVLDWEVSHPNPVGWCLQFLNRVKERTGVKALVYMNGSTLKAFDWSPVVSGDFGLWIASWGANDGNVPSNRPSSDEWGFYAIWQYTSNGSVPGIGGRVDLDLFLGDETAFVKYGNGTDIPAPTPAPAQPAPVQVPAPTQATYTVTPRDYDGLAAALARVGVSDWRGVASLNGLSDPFVIKAGMVLKLTQGVATPTDAWSGVYTVTARDADGLAAAMARIGIADWRGVAAHNGLTDPFTIKVGQQLRTPGGVIGAAVAPSYYTVTSRDSDGLAAAMSRIGVSDWRRIASLNGLSGDFVIHAGDKLRLV